MSSFIIHQKAKAYHWSGASWLSIKSFMHGHAHCKIGARSYRLDQNDLLILNDGTEYQITIDNKQKKESLCMFFEPGLVSDVMSNHVHSDGVSPFCYIAHQKISKAANLIKHSQVPIHEIANQLGYASYANFSTYFKKNYGDSPSEYRKSDS